jgi:hypothetical protein
VFREKFINSELVAIEKRVSLLQNERGVVLVFSLIVLVIMSLLAIFATTISNIEIQTSTNNEKFQTAFSLGEGVAVEGVGLLNNETYDNLISHTPDLTGTSYENWLDTHGIFFTGGTGPDLTNPANWDTGGDNTSPSALNQPMDRGGLMPPGFVAGVDHLHFAVQDTGIAAGYDETAEIQIRAYFLNGLYEVSRQSAFPGDNILEMGYRMPLVAPESL